MAKQRVVNTRLWADSYVTELDPIEKLLFVYLLTNQYTDICGIYEIPLKHIAMDTGIDKEMIEKIIGRFETDGKVVYSDGWIGIKNFVKWQNSNPSVNLGIKRCRSEAPSHIVQAVDRLSQAGTLNLT